MTLFYELHGACYTPTASSVHGDIGLGCLKSTAINLRDNKDRKTYITATDYDTKEKYLVWHWAMGDVPYEHRHISVEQFMEGI